MEQNFTYMGNDGLWDYVYIASYTKTYRINDEWSEYDKSVAECQLENYGVIYLDEYGLPIDDIYTTDDIFENFDIGLNMKCIDQQVMSYRIYIVRNGKEECLHGYGTLADIFDVVKFLRKKARIKWIRKGV